MGNFETKAEWRSLRGVLQQPASVRPRNNAYRLHIFLHHILTCSPASSSPAPKRAKTGRHGGHFVNFEAADAERVRFIKVCEESDAKLDEMKSDLKSDGRAGSRPVVALSAGPAQGNDDVEVDHNVEYCACSYGSS